MLVGDAKPIHSGGRCQIQAKTHLNDCADNEGPINAGVFSSRNFLSEFKPSLRIGFPEIDTGPQPIIVIFTRLECQAGQELLSNILIASVIAEHKTGG